MNKWDMSRIAARCEVELGLRVRQVFDLDEVAGILPRLEKGYLSPMLDPACNDFTPANSFWLVAEDESGPVMAGGVRCDDLRRVDITAYWKNHLKRTFGIQPAAAGLSFPADALQGKVAYFGDLKSTNALGLSRAGRSKMRYFTAIGHFLTAQEFSPDVTYCFVQEADAMRGTPSNYGFLQIHPFLYEWERDPYPVGAPEWVASLRADQLPQLLASVDRLIAGLVGKKRGYTPDLLHRKVS